MDAESYIMSNLDKIKQYLRIDGDDDAIVIRCALSSYRYIEDSVGEFDPDQPTAVMLLYAITQDLYDSRELMQSEQQVKKRQEYTYQSIILQLKMKYELKQET
jgi:uncharacterized phage protein (predicted DNA packaging)